MDLLACTGSKTGNETSNCYRTFFPNRNGLLLRNAEEPINAEEP